MHPNTVNFGSQAALLAHLPSTAPLVAAQAFIPQDTELAAFARHRIGQARRAPHDSLASADTPTPKDRGSAARLWAELALRAVDFKQQLRPDIP